MRFKQRSRFHRRQTEGRSRAVSLTALHATASRTRVRARHDLRFWPRLPLHPR